MPNGGTNCFWGNKFRVSIKWLHKYQRFHGVMVSTQDFESCDPSSNLGGTCIYEVQAPFYLPRTSVGRFEGSLHMRLTWLTQWDQISLFVLLSLACYFVYCPLLDPPPCFLCIRRIPRVATDLSKLCLFLRRSLSCSKNSLSKEIVVLKIQ